MRVVVAADITPPKTATQPGADPVVVLVERRLDHDDQVTTFALYADGLVVYRNPTAWTGYHADDADFHAVRLRPAEVGSLLDGVALPALEKLEASYEVGDATDPNTTELWLWSPAGRKVVVVRGSYLRRSGRVRTPTAFLDAYDRLKRYWHRDAKPWHAPVPRQDVWGR